MKHAQTTAKATYSPQTFKSFPGALCAFLELEFPQLAGNTTRLYLANAINDMVSNFYPVTSHLKPGQTPWITVDKNEKGSYGKSIKNTRLVPVVLNLVKETDMQERADGKKLRDFKKERVVSLANEAFEQGGCITNAELSILMKISPSTVSKYIKEWELEHNTVVPRRGSIHDIGPTLTHKKIIIHKLFIEQKSVQQTSRETYHSLPAIQRYISTFRQILLCYEKNMNIDEIAFAVKRTKRLVQEYLDIISSYAEHLKSLKEIIEKPIDIENNIKVWSKENGI